MKGFSILNQQCTSWRGNTTGSLHIGSQNFLFLFNLSALPDLYQLCVASYTMTSWWCVTLAFYKTVNPSIKFWLAVPLYSSLNPLLPSDKRLMQALSLSHPSDLTHSGSLIDWLIDCLDAIRKMERPTTHSVGRCN